MDRSANRRHDAVGTTSRRDQAGGPAPTLRGAALLHHHPAGAAAAAATSHAAAAGAGSAPKAAPPPPPPFKFDAKRCRLDWRMLHGVDVDRVVRPWGDA
jgi:hypothetical protein